MSIRAFNCIFFDRNFLLVSKHLSLCFGHYRGVSQTHLVCLLGFRGPTRDFFTHIIYHQYLWRAANFDQYSAVIVIKEWRFFRVIHLLWHGSYVYMVIQIKARDTHACWLAFGGGAITICSNDRIWGAKSPDLPAARWIIDLPTEPWRWLHRY